MRGLPAQTYRLGFARHSAIASKRHTPSSQMDPMLEPQQVIPRHAMRQYLYSAAQMRPKTGALAALWAHFEVVTWNSMTREM